MKKLSINDLRKTIKATEAERLKIQAPFRPEGPKLQRGLKAAQTITSQWMRDSGLDLDKLHALHAQRDTELQRLVARHKKEVLRLAAQRKNKLAIAAQGKALAKLAGRLDIFPNPSFSLDTPFLIWSTPLMSIDSSAAPFNSWAKFKIITQAIATQKVSFYFAWANPFSDYAVIDATTSLSASGYLRAHNPWGGLFADTLSSSVKVSAGLGLWLGVSSDLNVADYVTQELGEVYAQATFWGADVETTTISEGMSLSKTMFGVPPDSIVVFEVAVFVDYSGLFGNIEADFSSGDFQIACPVVVFSLLNSPPGGVG